MKSATNNEIHKIQSQTSQTSPKQKQQKQLSSRMLIKIQTNIKQQYKIYKILYTNNYFILSAQAKIIVYNLLNKQYITIKVCTTDYILINFPPYIFACFIGQFIYYYTEQALYDVSKIIKLKISKMNIKCLCNFNKGYFMGGYNRSIFPGGNLIDKQLNKLVQKQTIMVNLNPQKYKPYHNTINTEPILAMLLLAQYLHNKPKQQIYIDIISKIIPISLNVIGQVRIKLCEFNRNIIQIKIINIR